jgi:hypothetical protein
MRGSDEGGGVTYPDLSERRRTSINTVLMGRLLYRARAFFSCIILLQMSSPSLYDAVGMVLFSRCMIGMRVIVWVITGEGSGVGRWLVVQF